MPADIHTRLRTHRAVDDGVIRTKVVDNCGAGILAIDDFDVEIRVDGLVFQLMNQGVIIGYHQNIGVLLMNMLEIIAIFAGVFTESLMVAAVRYVVGHLVTPLCAHEIYGTLRTTAKSLSIAVKLPTIAKISVVRVGGRFIGWFYESKEVLLIDPMVTSGRAPGR